MINKRKALLWGTTAATSERELRSAKPNLGKKLGQTENNPSENQQLLYGLTQISTLSPQWGGSRMNSEVSIKPTNIRTTHTTLSQPHRAHARMRVTQDQTTTPTMSTCVPRHCLSGDTLQTNHNSKRSERLCWAVNNDTACGLREAPTPSSPCTVRSALWMPTPTGRSDRALDDWQSFASILHVCNKLGDLHTNLNSLPGVFCSLSSRAQITAKKSTVIPASTASTVDDVNSENSFQLSTFYMYNNENTL